jgi:hypothetical protein
MMSNGIFKKVRWLTVSIMLTACGGGGGGDIVTSQGSSIVTSLGVSTISGNAVKGPIDGAEVILVYFSASGQEIELPATNAPVTTNPNGSYKFLLNQTFVPDNVGPAMLRTIGGTTGTDFGPAPMLESVIPDLAAAIASSSIIDNHLSAASSVAARLFKMAAQTTGANPGVDSARSLMALVESKLDLELKDDPNKEGSSTASLNNAFDELLGLGASSANNTAVNELVLFLAANLSSTSGQLDNSMQDPNNPSLDIPAALSYLGNGHLANLFPSGPEQLLQQVQLRTDSTIIDTIGPSIVSAISSSNTQVVITFSEPLRVAETKTSSNYIMTAVDVDGQPTNSGRVDILDATFRDNNYLTLVLTTQSQSDIRYVLQLSGLYDLAGNPFQVPEKGLEGLDPSTVTIEGIGPTGDEIVDTDGDGLSDSDELRGWEVITTTAAGNKSRYTVSSDPLNPDTDGDGVTDNEEKHAAADPRSADTDGDTLSDNMEWNVLYSDPTNDDTDGDGTQDGFEFYSYRTSPVLADTDGDQISDTDEILNRNRNPRIADLPESGIIVGEVRLQINEKYTYEDEQGNTVEVADTSTSTLLQRQEQTFATSQVALVQNVLGVKAEAGVEGKGGRGTAFGLFFLVGGSYENTKSNTFSSSRTSAQESQQTHEQSIARTQTFETSSKVTREIVGARIDIDLSIYNEGSIAFTISNLEITMMQRDKQSTGRFIPVATLIPNTTILNGGTAVNDESARFSLGPFNPVRGPILFSNTDVFPNLVDELMKSPGGLIFKVSNYEIRDEFGRIFSFSSQIARDRTAGIIIDSGDGNLQQHLVATAAQVDVEGYGGKPGGIIGGFEADGSPQGIPLDYALQSILKLTKGNATADGILAGIDGKAESIAVGDDIQVSPVGTTGLTSRSIIISSGANGTLESIAEGNNLVDVTTGYETSKTCDAGSIEPGFACTQDSQCVVKISGGGLCNGPEILTRLGNQRNGDFNRQWVLFTNKENSALAAADFSKIILKARSDVSIAFLQDLDNDGLFAREEYLVGSIDSSVDNYNNELFGEFSEPTDSELSAERDFHYKLTNAVFGSSDGIEDSKDTDRDGIGDFAEVRVGWKVQSGTILKQTYSSPRLADSDGDGLLDIQEQDLRGFCDTNDTRQDALCSYQNQTVETVDNAIAIIAGPDGVVSTAAFDGDVQLIALGTTGVPYGAVIIGQGQVPGIQTELNGANLYDSGFSKPPTTDPSLSDTDNDGISDRVELLGFVAGLSIRDGGNNIADSIRNGDDIQAARFDTPVSDNGIVILPGRNGVLDTIMAGDDTLLDGIQVKTDPLREDTDGDSITDGPELAAGGNPVDEQDGVLFRDSDQDGISDADENLGWDVVVITPSGATTVRYKSNLSRPDSDLDGLPDFIERDLRTNPNNSDTDGDGLSDFDEMSGPLFERYFGLEEDFPRFSVNGSASAQYSTDPNKVDTDGDGLTDYEELISGYLLLDPIASQFRYIYTDPLQTDSDFDGRSDVQEINRTVNRTFPSTLSDNDYDILYNDESGQLASYTGPGTGIVVLCSSPCSIEGKSADTFGYLIKGLNGDTVRFVDQLKYLPEDVDIRSESVLAVTDATNPDTDGDGQSDGNDALPLVPDRSITVEIDSISLKGPPSALTLADPFSAYFFSAGWWVTVTEPDKTVTLVSDAADLRFHKPSIIYHDDTETDYPFTRVLNEEYINEEYDGPFLDRDANDTVPGGTTVPGEKDAGTGGGCNVLSRALFTQNLYINLDGIDNTNNPKSISLLEGESFRIDGAAVIFGVDDPSDYEISQDCGRAPTYIPSAIVSACFARLSQVFNYSDFSTLGSLPQSLTLQNKTCSIELNYNVKRQ